MRIAAAGGYVGWEKEKDICRIEFGHPQSNSMPGELLRLLANTITECGADKSNHVIHLTSGGERAFCAGASFDELAAIENEAQGLHFFSGFAQVISAMRKVPQPVVLSVQGKAVGGGVGIAAAADYAFAHQSADIKLSELAVGIGPFVIGPAVERKMGLSAYAELALDPSSWRHSSWALQKGLFQEVFESHADLRAAAEKFATTLATYSRKALFELKAVLWENTGHWEETMRARAALSGRLILSDESKAFISKFKAK